MQQHNNVKYVNVSTANVLMLMQEGGFIYTTCNWKRDDSEYYRRSNSNVRDCLADHDGHRSAKFKLGASIENWTIIQENLTRYFLYFENC